MHRTAAGLPSDSSSILRILATRTASRKSSPAMPAFRLRWRCVSGPAIVMGRIAIINRTSFGTWTSRALTPGRSLVRSTGMAHNELQVALRPLRLHQRWEPKAESIDKKRTVLAQALERSSRWRELSKNHLEDRSAFFAMAIAVALILMRPAGRRYWCIGSGSIRRKSL